MNQRPPITQRAVAPGRPRTLLLVAGLVLLAVGCAPGGTDASADTAAGRGGQIVVAQPVPGVVELSSNRFTCRACYQRVVPRLDELEGVGDIDVDALTGVSERGTAASDQVGTITVEFDEERVTADDIVLAARDGLEADPHNPHPVAILEAEGQ